MNSQKNILTISIIGLSLLALTNCSKDSITNPPVEKNKSYTINGKVENWIYGDTLKLIAGEDFSDSFYIFGSSKVNIDGSFSINLSAPPLRE